MKLFGRTKSVTPETDNTPIEVAKSSTVSLQKGGKATISLAKSASVVATLEWTGGSAFRRANGADLELYALYITHDGKSDLVYWNKLKGDGIIHHGDSLVPGVETVTISEPSKFKSVLIVAYSAISNGAGSFKSYGAKAVVTDGKSRVEVPLHDSNESYWVAIAQIDVTADGIDIRSVEKYGVIGSEARPVLNADGSFKMSAGPVEFKR